MTPKFIGHPFSLNPYKNFCGVPLLLLYSWGDWGSERCHKARMAESGFEPGSDSFQSSCIVFPLYSAFPNEAAHQTHWERPIKKSIFPDPTSDLFKQIFAAGPRNLYFKPWFVQLFDYCLPLKWNLPEDRGHVYLIQWQEWGQHKYLLWLNVQASQPWPMRQLWRAFKLFVANPLEQFSNFNVHVKNYLGCLFFFLMHIMRPQPQRFYAWETQV